MSDLKIDVQNLDLEWALLPELRNRYSQEATIIEKKIKLSKLDLGIVSAEIAKKIRKNPELFVEEGEKLTIKLIEEIVARSDEIIELQEEIIELETRRKIMMETLENLDYKRTSLTNLTKLYMSEFYSAPTTEKQMERFDKAYKEFDDSDLYQRLKMKRRKK